MACMDTLGLRELRQQASDLVRRAQAGEQLIITVSGRPAAVLGPVDRDTWRSYDEIADLFTTPTDSRWAADLRRIRDDVTDPWAD
jgi:prevent-host-death family protein